MDQIHKVVIIGGGVSGLFSAIKCCELGITPIVIEGGNYPSHKVCGEFLSPESLTILTQIGIKPIPILRTNFHSHDNRFTFTFPSPAGGLSHFTLDPILKDYAIKLGAVIYTDTKVASFIPKQGVEKNHQIILSNGNTLHCSSVIIATGRIPSHQNSLNSLTPKYIGIKAHFRDISLNNSLEMFSFKGAYLGVSPIEDNKVNVACLASINRMNRVQSPDQLINELMNENHKFKDLISTGSLCFEKWMTAPVPFFGFKPTPDWQDAYFIGDAAMSIPPASGKGLTLAIVSGILAAHYLLLRDFKGFKSNLKSKHQRQMSIAKGLHHMMMDPFFNNTAISISSIFPLIATLANNSLQVDTKKL